VADDVVGQGVGRPCGVAAGQAALAEGRDHGLALGQRVGQEEEGGLA
jgi:hypothetical protein